MVIGLRRSLLSTFLLVSTVLVSTAAPAAAERMCDPSSEDCRAILLDLIKRETVQIDVGFWFLEDARYTTAIIARWQQGVRVRVLIDTRVNAVNSISPLRVQELKDAGIPIRRRFGGGILHYKMMMFAGLGTVEFSGANYSAWALTPEIPYQNYTDEVIYFATDPAVVQSFMRRYDDLWTDTVVYTNYANVTAPLARSYPTYAIDPAINFVPLQDYGNRSLKLYTLETQKIDVIMYRITQEAHATAMIAAVQRGVPVRLITEPDQYRDVKRLWHSYNIDRMYMAGVQVRERAHAGALHQKSVILYGQGLSIFGSSNWSSPSASSQEEHNYFTTKNWIFQFMVGNFERKWNNSAGFAESRPFVPKPPDKPLNKLPANLATAQGTSLTLTWEGGPWAHKYDVYFGTTPIPPLFAADVAHPPSDSAADNEHLTVTNLAPGTTYYWRVVGKTMANMSAGGATWSFTTAGTPGPAPAPTLGAGDILLYASRATMHGDWSAAADASAAGGARLTNVDRGAPKISPALEAPINYVDLTFDAPAGQDYHLWMRMRAPGDASSSDSVHVQFSDSLDTAGNPAYQMNTSTMMEVVLEDCSGCGLSGWGWQDNGWGAGVLGRDVRFANGGTHTIRIQNREDGVWIDQILLSPTKFRAGSPGLLKNDTTIYPESGGAPPPAPQLGTGDVLLYASRATLVGDWTTVSDASAAGGVRLLNPDRGAPKVVTASATPASYAELTFNATPHVPYHLWMRMRATADGTSNDSVHVQFVDTIDETGGPIYQIGTTSGADVVLEDCSGCGVSGWGWQDNGWGVGVMGRDLIFRDPGPHTVRIQIREDGASIDQILLSPAKFLSTPPGTLKDDTTVYPESGGA